MAADTSGLQGLAEALAQAAAEIGPQGAAVVSRGALNIKNDWRSNARAGAGAHARLYPASISYDRTVSRAGASAVIGPDKARPQGPLGNLLEFGSVRNPPHNDGGRALLAEEPRFVQAAADLGEGLLQ